MRGRPASAASSSQLCSSHFGSELLLGCSESYAGAANMQVVQDRYAPGVQECFRRFDEDNSGSLGSSELRGGSMSASKPAQTSSHR